MTQDKTRAEAMAGPDAIEVRLLLNRKTGQLIVTGPTQAPSVMLEMLARAISQIGRAIKPKDGDGEAKPDIVLARPRIVRPM